VGQTEDYWSPTTLRGIFSRRFEIGLATTFLLIESLQRFYQYYGDDLQVRVSVILEVCHKAFLVVYLFYGIGGMSDG